MFNVNVDSGLVSQVGALTLAVTWALKKWVLPKMDGTMIACIGGALSTGAATFMSAAPVGTSVALTSGMVGTAVAGLTYDKVLNPALGKVWGWLQSIAPKK